MFQQVDDYIRRVLVEQKGVPGCQITVMRDHEVLHRYSAGYADREAGTPLTEDTMYFMYSCTKPITVAAGLRLVEEGLLELDAPVMTIPLWPTLMCGRLWNSTAIRLPPCR